jgi:hypothetical protein
VPESAEAWRARHPEERDKVLERCWICWEVLPAHWTTPHLYPAGRLVFIRDEQSEEPSDD